MFRSGFVRFCTGFTFMSLALELKLIVCDAEK